LTDQLGGFGRTLQWTRSQSFGLSIQREVIMQRRVYGMVTLLLSVTLFLLVMLLAACMPVQPVQETEEEFDPLLVEACESYMDIDLGQTYQRFEKPIFWTFHTHFLPVPNSDERLGCLRFYWRDNSAETFVGTLSSGLLITCTPSGIVDTQPMSPSIHSSNNARDPDDDSLPQRRTYMAEEGYVACPLDIGASLAAISGTSGVEADLAGLDPADAMMVTETMELMIAEPKQLYDEFMAAAAIESVDESPLQPNPILFYQPEAGTALTPTGVLSHQVEFSLTPFGANPAFMGTRLSGIESVSSNSGDGASCLARAPRLYLWVDYGQCSFPADPECTLFPGQPNYLQFLSREPGSGFDACRIDTGVEGHPFVQFWAGSATLYIGYNPDTDTHIPDALYFYEVWLDPDSAIKPGD
jgi:hypothetical protein